MNRPQLRHARDLLGRARNKGGAAWGPWEACNLSDPRWREHVPSGCVNAWKNRAYVVQQYLKASPFGLIDHLMIVANDAAPVRSWPDLQRIKNELCGADREAVEVYPPESEKVDDRNVYHLWVLPAGRRIGFGLRVPAVQG